MTRPGCDPALLDPDLLAELTSLAELAAHDAALLIHDGRPDRVEVATTKSSPQDVVTAMDLAAEERLRQVLHQARPTDGILGEEQGYEPGTSGVTWVIDPIDGTVNYLYGLASYAVLVAAVASQASATVAPDPATWTVLASCVRAPALGRTWTATRGGGAYRDGRRLTLDHPPELGMCLLGTGFGYRREVRELQGRVVAELLPQVRDLRRMGSAGLDLCAVADGGLDLYYERGLNPWDLAAGSLVAAEAGAQVIGLRGVPAGEAMTVAGHPERLPELLTWLEQAGADQPV